MATPNYMSPMTILQYFKRFLINILYAYLQQFLRYNGDFDECNIIFYRYTNHVFLILKRLQDIHLSYIAANTIVSKKLHITLCQLHINTLWQILQLKCQIQKCKFAGTIWNNKDSDYFRCEQKWYEKKTILILIVIIYYLEVEDFPITALKKSPCIK